MDLISASTSASTSTSQRQRDSVDLTLETTLKITLKIIFKTRLCALKHVFQLNVVPKNYRSGKERFYCLRLFKDKEDSRKRSIRKIRRYWVAEIIDKAV
jgi:hypothetical protein